MEATSLPAKPALAGELILQNGRHSGARRPLAFPNTFLGSAAGCEVRLNVPEVEPLHCLIVLGPTGAVLRDLHSERGTLVNGKRVSTQSLRDGDLIEVGPFRFRLHLVHEDWDGGEEPSALGVQVAAVAAQQVALDEEEARLQQRREDLQRQEEQLAAHLEEKRRQLEQWSEQHLAEREAWLRDKAKTEQHLAAQTRALAQVRDEQARDRRLLLNERERLNRVLQRLRQRWQRHRTLERQRSAAEQEALVQRQAELRCREQALAEEILHFNTERVLVTRQLQDGQAILHAARQRWRRRRARERAALRLRLQEVSLAEQRLQQVRAVVLQEKQAWEAEQRRLHQELHGLNNRVINQHHKVQEQQQELARLAALLGPAPPALAAAPALDTTEWQQRCERLERLAGELADQRAHLLEQWERLATVQQTWQEQRDGAATELEGLAQKLLQQEQTLGQRELRIHGSEDTYHRRQEEMAALREEVRLWRSRLQAREQELQAERRQLLDEVRRREAWAEGQLTLLTELRDSWQRQRTEQLARLETERAAVEQLHAVLARLREEYVARAGQVETGWRRLTERALALAEYRRRVLARSQDPAALRKIQRLRRRWLERNKAELRKARRERKALTEQLVQLDSRQGELLRRTAELSRCEAELAAKQVELQEREALFEADRSRLETTVHLAEAQRRLTEQRLSLLKDETERLAQALLDDEDPPSVPLAA